MTSAIAHSFNLSVLGGADVASTPPDATRELSIDELVWVGGGEVVIGTK